MASPPRSSGIDGFGYALAIAGAVLFSTKGVFIKLAYAEGLTPDTPAAAADIQAGDLIERIDGQAVGSLEEVYRTLAARDPGMEVTLDINRGGQKLQPKMKLVPRVP